MPNASHIDLIHLNNNVAENNLFFISYAYQFYAFFVWIILERLIIICELFHYI